MALDWAAPFALWVEGRRDYPMCPTRPQHSIAFSTLASPSAHLIVYDPRPTTTTTTTTIKGREAQIERQRLHLHDIDLWAKRLKGPCKQCRWREGWDLDYATCTNPAVTKGKTSPTTGDVTWTGPRCTDERSETYPTRYAERWRDGPTLCGPEGLLFEPRTTQQVVSKWLLISIPAWLLALDFVLHFL